MASADWPEDPPAPPPPECPPWPRPPPPPPWPPDPPPPQWPDVPPPPPDYDPPVPKGYVKKDPVAQSFKLPVDSFVTSIDIFVATIDPVEKDFWVSIRDMKNGFPLNVDIAKKDCRTEDVTVSTDASKAFTVTFDYPVFVTGGKEYCFVVGGWSPGTRIWLARVGDPLINDSTKTVDTQPSLGSSFRSQNGDTWNAEQFEDVKYTLRVAKFKSTDLDVVFSQKNEREILPEDPFECQVNLNQIRVYCESHGLSAGDKFTISMFEKESIFLETDSGVGPKIDQKIYVGTGSAEIYNVKQEPGGFRVYLKNVVGHFQEGDPFNCNAVSLVSRKGAVSGTISPVKGTILQTHITSLAGLPVTALVGEHVVLSADTPHTLIFEIDPSLHPSASGRFGGKNVYISTNTKYEVFNTSASYMLYGSSEDWTFRGLGHNPQNGIFTSADYKEQAPVTFTPGSDVHLGIPYKVASDENEALRLKGSRSVKLRAQMTSKGTNVSPVINMNTLSTMFISNHVGKAIQSEIAVNPNPDTRFFAESSVSGSESYKYVTRSIKLEKPASDLTIAFDVYKDKDADFDVYYKVVYTHSNDDIELVDWIQIPVVTKRNSVDLDDRVEYELLASDIFGSQWSGKEFHTFKIKLVGKADNTAKPPLFKNFRAIALT